MYISTVSVLFCFFFYYFSPALVPIASIFITASTPQYFDYVFSWLLVVPLFRHQAAS